MPLEFENAEGRYSREPADTETPETIYERRWALTLLERTLGRLRREFEAAGKQALFARLEGHLTGEQETLPYADLCAELEHERRGDQGGDAPAAAAVRRPPARGDRRDGVRPREVDDEIRELFRALKGE